MLQQLMLQNRKDNDKGKGNKIETLFASLT